MISTELDALIRSHAASLLIAQKPRSFYALGLIDLRRFQSGGAYLIETIQAFSAQSGAPLPSPLPDGLTLKEGGSAVLILYNQALHPHRRNWTIAHELGHLLLSHAAPSPENERQADAFAAALLMPAVVIAVWEEKHGMKMTEEEMLRAFNVSPLSAARRRRDLDFRGYGSFSEKELELARLLFSKGV